MNRKKEYKDIEKWRKTCNRQKLKYYAKTRNAINRCQPWTAEEVDIVMRHEITDHMISKLIGRSVQAIQGKRAKEKKKRGKGK